jgi:hypothetical protein
VPPYQTLLAPSTSGEQQHHHSAGNWEQGFFSGRGYPLRNQNGELAPTVSSHWSQDLNVPGTVFSSTCLVHSQLPIAYSAPSYGTSMPAPEREQPSLAHTQTVLRPSVCLPSVAIKQPLTFHYRMLRAGVIITMALGVTRRRRGKSHADRDQHWLRMMTERIVVCVFTTTSINPQTFVRRCPVSNSGTLECGPKLWGRHVQ